MTATASGHKAMATPPNEAAAAAPVAVVAVIDPATVVTVAIKEKKYLNFFDYLVGKVRENHLLLWLLSLLLLQPELHY